MTEPHEIEILAEKQAGTRKERVVIVASRVIHEAEDGHNTSRRILEDAHAAMSLAWLTTEELATVIAKIDSTQIGI